MKPIVKYLLGTEFLQEKSLRSKYLPNQEKRLWTSLAVKNQKFAADGSPEFQSSMSQYFVSPSFFWNKIEKTQARKNSRI